MARAARPAGDWSIGRTRVRLIGDGLGVEQLTFEARALGRPRLGGLIPAASGLMTDSRRRWFTIANQQQIRANGSNFLWWVPQLPPRFDSAAPYLRLRAGRRSRALLDVMRALPARPGHSLEVCKYGTAETGDAAINSASNIEVVFNFVYGKPVEFYQETVPVKIARILDIFRAPEAAKDQLGMKLYDVDALSAQGYRDLLKKIQPKRESDEADAESDEPKYANQPIMAFVAALNTGPWTNLSAWHEEGWASRKIDFIGAPVQWNSDVVALMEYEAGESDLYKAVSECAEYSNRKLIKRAMYDVIASAEGINEETPDAQRFAESAVSKMYLAIMSGSMTLEDETKGLSPIRTVSFRSAWEEALTQK